LQKCDSLENSYDRCRSRYTFERKSLVKLAFEKNQNSHVSVIYRFAKFRPATSIVWYPSSRNLVADFPHRATKPPVKPLQSDNHSSDVALSHAFHGACARRHPVVLSLQHSCLVADVVRLYLDQASLAESRLHLASPIHRESFSDPTPTPPKREKTSISSTVDGFHRNNCY
jgi:hypothetical protein